MSDQKIQDLRNLLFRASAELATQMDWANYIDADSVERETMIEWREDRDTAKQCLVEISKTLHE